MKKKLLLIIALIALLQNIYAYDFDFCVNNLYYKVVSSENLTVEVAHTQTNYNNGLTVPQNVSFQGINFTVIGIQDSAFIRFEMSAYITGEVILPQTIQYIGKSAFERQGAIQRICCPSNVISSIGMCAFKQCQQLQDLIIGTDSITSNVELSINSNAFYGCNQLTAIHLHGIEEPPIVLSNALNHIPAYASIYVPCASIIDYQHDESWSRFSHFYGIGAMGELSVSSYNDNSGSVQITDSADCDSPATIIATANYGYHFSSWNDGNTDNPRIIMIESDTSFTAFFERNKYYVHGLAENNIMGFVLGSDSTYYLDTVTLMSVANYGFVFSHWEDNITDNPRRVVAIGNIEYLAYFDSTFFTLMTLTDNEQMGYARIGSSEYMANSIGNYKYLSSQTLYATANNGYQFTQWSDGVTLNPRTVTILNDTSFTAQFAPQYVLTVISDDETMGNVFGGGLFNNNSTAIISAQANYGYHFIGWNDGVTSSARTINITCDTTFTAFFARNQYGVTATSDNPSWGVTSGSGMALFGDTITLTATSIGQHHFTYWFDGEHFYYDNPLQVWVTKNDSYTAYFAVNQYSITVLTDGGGNGYVSLDGTSNSCICDYLSQVTIRAVPNSGTRFVQWSDGITYNPRTVTITKDTILMAIFAADIHTVTVETADSIMGSVIGEGDYLSNSVAIIAAIPNHGYMFDHWQDNNTVNPRIVNVSTNMNFTAYFTTYDTIHIHDTTYIDIPYPVHDTSYFTIYDTITEQLTWFALQLTSDNTNMGVAAGSGYFPDGTNVEIAAIPIEGNRFLQWSDGSSLNPRTITVSTNITLTALFESVNVENYTLPNWNVYTNQNLIVIRGVSGHSVRIYDSSGKLLQHVQNAPDVLRYTVDTSGVYIIQIDNNEARKVSVIKR